MSEYVDITNLIDVHIGKTAYACAMGPSFKKYLNTVEENKNNNVVVTCSDFHTMTNLKPNYWVFANSMKDIINSLPDTTLVYADSVDPTHRDWVLSNLKYPFVGYDQRHFNGKKCNECPNGCSNLIPNRKTIQEVLQDYTGYNKRYGTGETVALHVLALSIIMGCKDIYLFGVDLDYSLGYVDDKTQNYDSFNPYLSFILDDFDIIVNSAKKIGVNVYNMSETSPLKNIIKTLNTL
jgi:hypothetical protein